MSISLKNYHSFTLFKIAVAFLIRLAFLHVFKETMPFLNLTPTAWIQAQNLKIDNICQIVNGLHCKPFKYKNIRNKIFLNCNGLHCKPFKYKKILNKIFLNCNSLHCKPFKYKKLLNKIFLNCNGLQCKLFKYKR